MDARRFLPYCCPLFLIVLVLVLAPLSVCYADSPYGNILKSINKEPSQVQQQPQSGTTTPSQQPTPSPVRPAPTPVKQQAPPSLKGKKIKANLELTISVSGGAHNSSSEQNKTSVSSYQSSGTSDSKVDGKAIVSVAFEEAPAFPDIPASNAMVLAPIGTFTYYLDRKRTNKSQWSGSEKVLGDYIVHPQKSGSFQGRSHNEESIRCEGREVYEGAKYETTTTAGMPSMNVPQQKVRHLGPGPILNLQEQSDGTMKYSFSVDTMGQCTVKTLSESHTGSSSDSYNSEDHFMVSIEGTFPKGQKVVQLTPDNVDHYFPTETTAGGKSEKLKVTVTGTLSFIAKPGELQVTPGDGLASSGPDDKDRFAPASKTYVLKNTGESPLDYRVSKTQKWLTLSGTQGKLEPNQTAKVKASVDQQAAKNLKEGDYKDALTFTNATNGRGDTSRQVSLHVGEEQTWRVLLSGQETDDVGGKLMYTKLQDKWGYQVVNYGVRFNYKLTAEFTIRKKKGKWTYKKGVIKSASVAAVNVFDPDVFFVKKTVCRNCDEVNGLAGQSLGGDVDGSTVQLYWPKKIANAVVYNKLKLQHNSKEESHKGYSANEFFSEAFFLFASSHDLPLKNGEVPPKKRMRKSSVDQFRQKNKKPIFVYHRYVMQRIR